VALVRDGGYEGIDLAYASVDQSLDVEFTEFVNVVAEGLHAEGSQLILTLPPPATQGQAYDWSAIGKSADLLRILPIANPITYWESMPEAMDRLVEDVDPAKVLLVLSPFSVEAVGDVVRPLGYLQAMALAGEAAVREPEDPNEIEPGSTVKLVAANLDQGEGASTLSWDDDAATVTFTMGGTERRTIYIENAFSFGFKLELVQAYGLAGVSVSDASAQSDVPDVWPTVNGLVESATVTLSRPNESALLPLWQAPSGGDLGAGAGTTATWIPQDTGTFEIVLVVSDGVRRFGRETFVGVGEPDLPDTTETPIVTFDDIDGEQLYTNEEFTSVGSIVRYLVTFDNDSDVEVTITGYSDNTYPDIVCNDVTLSVDVIGLVLGVDTGDGPGTIDGGSDEIQCIFTVNAPDDVGVVVINTITGTVESAGGDIDADQDNAAITTIEAPAEAQ
jgi:hypothetical protein